VKGHEGTLKGGSRPKGQTFPDWDGDDDDMRSRSTWWGFGGGEVLKKDFCRSEAGKPTIRLTKKKKKVRWESYTSKGERDLKGMRGKNSRGMRRDPGSGRAKKRGGKPGGKAVYALWSRMTLKRKGKREGLGGERTVTRCCTRIKKPTKKKNKEKDLSKK